MEAVGLRVVRGSDWIWGGQDGGEGCVGTVVKPSKSQNDIFFNDCVFVRWDCGQIANYRAGLKNNFDLCVFDTSLIGSKHVGFSCNTCEKNNLVGIRWKCKDCGNYNLCNHCYTSDKHQLSHSFTRYDLPTSKGVLVPPRGKSTKVEAMGIYPGATVVRGPDWRWENQDGGDGSVGLVCEVTEKKGTNLYQSWCKVTWEKAGTNEYRRGHEGALDLCSILPSSGGFYYPEHLAKLGKDLREDDMKAGSVGRGETFSDVGEILVGDKVTICLEPDIFKALQDGHGGWNDRMAECFGSVGQVISKMDAGDFIVKFPGFEKPCRINPVALSKQIDFLNFRKGDLVKISNNESLVLSLQENHGGWIEAMQAALGRVGKVTLVDDNGDLRVLLSDIGGHWCFNPRCCTLVRRTEKTSKGSTSSSGSSDDDIEPMIHNRMSVMHEVFSNPSNLVAAAANGVLPHVREILSRHPDQVDVRNCGKTALQMACLKGHIEVIEVLINSGADLMARDDEGDTPVHFAVIENQPVALEILIAAGADVSALNKNLLSPLHVAVRKGYRRCVEILLESNCYTNLQDNTGDTALHDAIGCNNNELVELLVNASDFDFYTKNERGFNVLQQAALTGNCRAAKCILKKVPELIDVTKDDGMTPLHIAVINGHAKVAEVLIDAGKANLDRVNIVGHTPLQIAILQNQIAVIEVLVLRGADVNIPDEDGNTPLHSVLHLVESESAKKFEGSKILPLAEAPFIAKLKESLPSDLSHFQWLPVAVFLLKHRADLSKTNANGRIPLDVVKNQSLVNYLQKISTSIRMSSECIMCSESPVQVTFRPCGHQIVCKECGTRMKKCFRCGSTIEGIEPKHSAQESSIYCAKCEKNVRNVVFLCGHGCCDVCLKAMKHCHICDKSTEPHFFLFKRNAANE